MRHPLVAVVWGVGGCAISAVLFLACGARSEIDGFAAPDAIAESAVPEASADVFVRLDARADTDADANGPPRDADAEAEAAPPACRLGEARICGSNVGACRQGLSSCMDGQFGPCDGEVAPVVEVCNGVDDDCDGVVDADCEVGSCSPQLLVTGSVPSSPRCIDFPIVKGSVGTLMFQCEGSSVTADLGGVTMVGTVQSSVVNLVGAVVQVYEGDGCTWEFTHTVSGSLINGDLTYGYSERVLSGTRCANPCTEAGTVKVVW